MVVLNVALCEATESKDVKYTEGPYTYVIENDGVVIVGYFGSDEVVVIPGHITGHPVTRIKEGTFSYSTVKELKIRESVVVEDGAVPEGAVVSVVGSGEGSLEKGDSDTGTGGEVSGGEDSETGAGGEGSEGSPDNEGYTEGEGSDVLGGDASGDNSELGSKGENEAGSNIEISGSENSAEGSTESFITVIPKGEQNKGVSTGNIIITAGFIVVAVIVVGVLCIRYKLKCKS